MFPSAITALLKAKAKTKSELGKMCKEALKAPRWNFQGQPDEIRKLVRDSLLKDLKAMTYPSLVTTAKEYGVSPANVVAWKKNRVRIGETYGQRGRPKGVKDSKDSVRYQTHHK